MSFYFFHKILKIMFIILILGIGNLSFAQNQSTPPENLIKSAAEVVEMSKEETFSEETIKESAEVDKEGASPQETVQEEGGIVCGSIKTIEKLQLEWSNKDEKRTLIDELSHLESDDLQKCLCTNTDKELMGVTIMDLSRHTNTELAQKAKNLIELFDPVACVNEMLSSTDQYRYENIVMFLLRIQSDQAKDIFDKVSFAEDDSQNKLYMEKIIFDGFIPHLMPVMLVPTASEEGDRYYVKTEWDPNNEGQFNCLSELFKDTVMAKSSVEKEKDWMKKLNGTRWMYWYSKEWAMGLAQGIKKCGAKASFVKGPNS